MKASWLKKNWILFYGFKLHMSIDMIHGFITDGYFTPANYSNTKEFVKLIELNDAYLKINSYILVDKGYTQAKKTEKR